MFVTKDVLLQNLSQMKSALICVGLKLYAIIVAKGLLQLQKTYFNWAFDVVHFCLNSSFLLENAWLW